MCVCVFVHVSWTGTHKQYAIVNFVICIAG